MIPTFISIFFVPLYLSTTDPTMFLILFMLMICFVGGKDALNPGWLSERFPTEVRATAAGFVYHQGAVWGAFVAPVLTYFAVNQQMGFAKPMLYATVGSLIVYVISVYLGPETKGKEMTAALEIFEQDDVLNANRVKQARMNAALQPLRELPVEHLRNTGMIWAFDVVDAPPDFARRFYEEALAHGLLLRPIGNTVYFMPPYVISDGEIDWLAAQTLSVLRKVLA